MSSAGEVRAAGGGRAAGAAVDGAAPRARTQPQADLPGGERLALLTSDGTVFALRHELTIGQARHNDVVLRDPCVSRRHCVVELRESRAFVRDLTSTNGTYVNGVRVPHAELRAGALLTIGDTRLRVVCDAGGGEDELIGRAPAMAELRREIGRWAASRVTVLIHGETGTGKELVARALHRLSGRAGAFVPVNCGSLPRELVESELFGHERGAFTGADARRPGVFQQADRGTLFLDEIGELPLGLQTRLLRVLETGMVRPVGADREVSVDVRVVAATHVDLEHAVGARAFRRDLYFRLAQAVVPVPPLRARAEDIALLAARFLAEEAAHGGPRRLSDEAEAALRAHGWPGNVRELRNVLRRAAAVSHDLIGSDDLALDRLPVVDADELVDSDTLPLAGRQLWEIERAAILRAVTRAGGNQRIAAAELAIPPSTLSDKLRRYDAPTPPPPRVRRRTLRRADG